ncbi:HEAT repeat domain-containing protein [Amycolatopsis sp. NPDC005003]
MRPSPDEVAGAILDYYELPANPPAPFENFPGAAGLPHREVVDRIAADPGFQAERIAELKNDPALPQYRAEASGLLASLAEAGLPVLVVSHLDELRLDGEKLDYQAQVPLLVAWLDRTDYFPLMGELVRTLSYAFAKKQARPVFLKLFRDLPELRTAAGHEVTEYDRENLRWVIGLGLAKFADHAVAEEYLDLITDAKYGGARTALVSALPKLKDDRAAAVAMSLLDDPSVAHMAVRALGKLNHTEAKPRIRALLADLPSTWDDNEVYNVRTEARKVLKKLG